MTRSLALAAMALLLTACWLVPATTVPCSPATVTCAAKQAPCDRAVLP